MRISLLITLLGIFTACGSSQEERPENADSVADSVAQYSDSSSFLAQKYVGLINIPALISDSIDGYSGHVIDKRTSEDLLPADFEYEVYSEVRCVAKSKISHIPILWFRLISDGSYEESPPAVDILMVMYDNNYQPIDVCNVRSSDLGSSFSYVRADSIFTMSIDEMENINMTTTELAITEKGFVVGPTETHTFDYGKEGKQESIDFKNAYFSKRGATMIWIQ